MTERRINFSSSRLQSYKNGAAAAAHGLRIVGIVTTRLNQERQETTLLRLMYHNTQYVHTYVDTSRTAYPLYLQKLTPLVSIFI